MPAASKAGFEALPVDERWKDAVSNDPAIRSRPYLLEACEDARHVASMVTRGVSDATGGGQGIRADTPVADGCYRVFPIAHYFGRDAHTTCVPIGQTCGWSSPMVTVGRKRLRRNRPPSGT